VAEQTIASKSSCLGGCDAGGGFAEEDGWPALACTPTLWLAKLLAPTKIKTPKKMEKGHRERRGKASQLYNNNDCFKQAKKVEQRRIERRTSSNSD
jgi:hypothetical protein